MGEGEQDSVSPRGARGGGGGGAAAARGWAARPLRGARAGAPPASGGGPPREAGPRPTHAHESSLSLGTSVGEGFGSANSRDTVQKFILATEASAASTSWIRPSELLVPSRPSTRLVRDERYGTREAIECVFRISNTPRGVGAVEAKHTPQV